METATTVPAVPKPKPARRRKKRRAAPRAAAKPAAPPAVAPAEFAGLTAQKCPSACTADHCVISTTGICKHPLIAPDSGCGPITMANRLKALKIIKRQKIEAA